VEEYKLRIKERTSGETKPNKTVQTTVQIKRKENMRDNIKEYYIDDNKKEIKDKKSKDK
jgi:hypothetical protein